MNFLSVIPTENHIVRLLAKSTFYGQFWRGHQTIIWRTGKGFVQCSCLNGLSILKSISSWRKIGDYTPVINLDAHQDRGRAGIGVTEFSGFRLTSINMSLPKPVANG